MTRNLRLVCPILLALALAACLRQATLEVASGATAAEAAVAPTTAGAVQLMNRALDPYGYPRPGRDQEDVPLNTSFFFQLSMKGKESTDTVVENSVSLQLEPADGKIIDVLKPGREFCEGFSGKVFRGGRRGAGSTVVVYADSAISLDPLTSYTAHVKAESKGGAVMEPMWVPWRFVTEAAPKTHPLAFTLDTGAKPIKWHGGFFTGFCKPSFCTSASNRIPSYDLMDEVRKKHPKAWSLQRDFTMTSMMRQPQFLSGGAGNAVRERETRRITAMEKREDGILLRLKDVFGHEQYDIPSNRPITADFHPGDEVLIADGVSDTRAMVRAIIEDGETAKSILLAPFDAPEEAWKIAYSGSLPTEEDPGAPGLFPPGGCYLYKFKPAGTPHYYWGRIDKEWDIAHRQYGRRLQVNFPDAPADLAVDARNWTIPKDYIEYHEVVRMMTDHVLERYDDACLEFIWSVFNEPDLWRLFWRSGDWDELQRFYDYTVDAILRAFEDRGYDSDKVFIGGLELGGIFGVNLRIRKFLVHCSPRAEEKGAVTLNAAYADKRLDGKRSKRLEELCAANDGKGSPCDFVSVHSYNRSEIMAAKLIKAKDVALDVDPEYYADLWVDSFEACPEWAPPPDVAATDSYLGNGYFPTWCVDVVRRQLAKAVEDPRYAYGETVLTFWPWPNSNFGGANACTRNIAVDDDGNGRVDRQVSVAMPILHFLGLLSDMGDDYWVLPNKKVGGHIVSGVASKAPLALRVMLYSHNMGDPQSRSGKAFKISLDLKGLGWDKVRVTEYRYDKDNNSYFRLAQILRDRPIRRGKKAKPRPGELDRLIKVFEGDDEEAQIKAILRVVSFGAAGTPVHEAIGALHERTKSDRIRKSISIVANQTNQKAPACSSDEIAEVERLSKQQVTGDSIQTVAADGTLRLSVAVAGNGANFVVIEPAQ
jgi:hypothetical protein